MALAFVDLKAQYAAHKTDIDARVRAVLEHGQYINGPEVGELESELERFVGIPAVACSSGTDALVMALMALGVQRGDVVVTSPFTFVATVEAIQTLGATPMFVDIDADSFNIDVHDLDEVVSTGLKNGKQIKGVMPVDLFGLPADYEGVAEIAKKHGLWVLGDGAQSMGSSYRGTAPAQCCRVWTTSFFPAKPLGCYGDGGAIFTADAELRDVLRSIREHGQGEDRYDTVRMGLNGRLDTLQAAVLLAKLPHLAEEIDARNRVARWYTEAVQDCVKTPRVPAGYRSAWAQYTVVSDRRDHIAKALRDCEIPSAVYYRKPLHLQPALGQLGYGEGDFPVAEQTATRVLSLPMHPFLDAATAQRICAVVRQAQATA